MVNDGDTDWRQVSNIGNNGWMREEPAQRLDMSLSNVYAAERKNKGWTGLDHSIPWSN